MFKFHDSAYLTSDVFNSNILAIFGTKKLSFAKKDQKIFLTIKQRFPFINAVVMLDQFHSNKIITLKEQFNRSGFHIIGKGDGIITDFSNLVIAVFTGDCLPVILSNNKLIGIYHAGWKGTLANIAKSAILAMKQLGGNPSEIKVAFGPSIGLCCYSVDKRRAELFSQFYPKWKDKILIFRKENIFLNFPLLNYLQLLEVGIRRENIDYFPFCTSCDHRFFSLRRDGSLKKEMISFVVKRK